MNLHCMLLGHRLRSTRRPGHFGVECTRCGKDATVPLPKGPLVLAHWRPHTEPATLGTVALIALQDKDDGCWFMAWGPYVAKHDGWRCEAYDMPLDARGSYCWLPEHELLAGLRAPT